MTELENTLAENQKDMDRLNDLVKVIPVETMMKNSEAVGKYLFTEIDRCKAVQSNLGMVKEAQSWINSNCH